MKDFDYEIYTDGASRNNPGICGIGGFVKDSDGNLVLEVSECIGVQTSNYAEYMAVKTTLESLIEKDKDIGKKKIVLFADSKLVVCQLSGEWKIKNANIIPIYRETKKLIDDNDLDIKFIHINREKNSEADMLANQGIDNK